MNEHVAFPHLSIFDADDCETCGAAPRCDNDGSRVGYERIDDDVIER